MATVSATWTAAGDRAGSMGTDYPSCRTRPKWARAPRKAGGEHDHAVERDGEGDPGAGTAAVAAAPLEEGHLHVHPVLVYEREDRAVLGAAVPAAGLEPGEQGDVLGEPAAHALAGDGGRA